MHILLRLLAAAVLLLPLVSCDRLLQQMPPAESAEPRQEETAPVEVPPSEQPMLTPQSSPDDRHGDPGETPFDPTPEIPPPID